MVDTANVKYFFVKFISGLDRALVIGKLCNFPEAISITFCGEKCNETLRKSRNVPKKSLKLTPATVHRVDALYIQDTVGPIITSTTTERNIFWSGGFRPPTFCPVGH